MPTVVARSAALGNVVCDLDGVLYLGGDPLPGAGEALHRLAGRGYRIVFATNNSTKTPADVAQRIADLSGFETSPDQVVTSGIAAAAMLGAGDGPVLVVGEAGIREACASIGLVCTDDPDAAGTVVAGLTRSFDYGQLAVAARALQRGARFIATNTDPTLPTPAGPLPGAGSIVAAVATAGGRSPEVAGKPHPAMAGVIRARLGAGPTWVVGDRPETDLALAAAQGWTGVLVLTGVTPDPTGVPDTLKPAIVVDRLGDLPAVLP